jgi:hypothetical protein
MRSFLPVRSKMSVILSLVALTSIMSGLVFFLGAGISPHTAVAKSLKYSDLSPIQRRFVSGLIGSDLASQPAGKTLATMAAHSTFSSTSDTGCPQNHGNNVAVSQNCMSIADLDLQGRGQVQTEPTIAEDPLHSGHLVAGFNDYRSGDSHCGSAFSQDGGQNWTDTTIPVGFSNGANFGGVDREYWQVSGNTSVAWDTKGNAYLTCEAFMRGPGVTNNPDGSTAFYLFRSTGSGGASWNFPGHAIAELFTQEPEVLLDRPRMTIDNRVGSPFQDRIYVSWTALAEDGSFYIFEAHSTDYGQSFSAPALVSSSSALCVNNLGTPTPHGSCNASEFSLPFTGPDGALYVVYNNFNAILNSASDNHFQILLSKSTDGGQTFSSPVLAGSYYDLPDCATYQGGQNAGVNCLPEKGASQKSVFRAANFASGAVNPINGAVVVVFGSYINQDSNPATGCIPGGFTGEGDVLYTGVKTAGACSNKILESVSTNGGASFNGNVADPTTMTVVNSASSQRATDQWFPTVTFTNDGKLEVLYYDRQYGQDETNGSFDVSLSASRDLHHFAVNRITSSSLPAPTQFPSAQGNGTFLGDYIGVVADTNVHTIWADTRTPDLALCPGTGLPGVPPRVCTFTSVPNGPMANDQVVFAASVSE